MPMQMKTKPHVIEFHKPPNYRQSLVVDIKTSS